METENNFDIVQLFNVRLCYYLTRISRTCCLIRKHKENLHACGDFSFPVQLKYWLKYLQNCVKCEDSFMPTFAAENPKTILEYSCISRTQVAGGETVCDGVEWVRLKIELEPLTTDEYIGFVKNPSWYLYCFMEYVFLAT